MGSTQLRRYSVDVKVNDYHKYQPLNRQSAACLLMLRNKDQRPQADRLNLDDKRSPRVMASL